jgi:outer membrane protein, adhesin transport system
MRTLVLALLAALCAPTAQAQFRCNEDEPAPSRVSGPSLEISSTDPRGQLLALIELAQRRSDQLGASTLLAQAAREDWEEARAARLPRVQSEVTAGAAGQQVGGQRQSQGQAGLNLSVSAPLWDAGRIEANSAWRAQLAEAARQGLFSAEQQIAAQVVSFAMERGRLVLQGQVYRQYMRRMSCLVEALDTVVKADKGRASELIQAQKSQMQAELAMEQTLAGLRSTETKLKRLVGDTLPPSASFSSVLTQVPDLTMLQRAAEQSPDMLQMDAGARAQSRLAASIAAQNKPQLSVGANAAATTTTRSTRAGDWGIGVTLTVPLISPGQDSARTAALKRAGAADLQAQEAMRSRLYQMTELHESAVAALDRARRIVDILRNSDRLRAATLVQWQQMGRRSLFDVMGSESDYYSLRVAHISTLFEAQQAVAVLWSLGPGMQSALR